VQRRILAAEKLVKVIGGASDLGRGEAASELAELDGVLLLVAPLPWLGADDARDDPAEPRQPPSPSSPAPMRASRRLIAAAVAGSRGPADGR
jgi:hypothetical protein